MQPQTHATKGGIATKAQILSVTKPPIHRDCWYRRFVAIVWAVVFGILLLVFVPVGVLQWQPMARAAGSLLECDCTVRHTSLTVALECPTNACAFYYTVNVVVASSVDRGCPALLLSWDALYGEYAGNYTDPLLLGKWPVGSSVACYWSADPMLACSGLCLDTSSADAVSLDLSRKVRLLVTLLGGLVIMVAVCLAICSPCCCRACDHLHYKRSRSDSDSA